MKMQIPARIWRGSVDLSFMENMQMRKRLLALALTAVLIGAQALPVPAEEGAEIYDEELLPEGEEEEIIEAVIDDEEILTDPEEGRSLRRSCCSETERHRPPHTSLRRTAGRRTRCPEVRPCSPRGS